MLVAVDFIKDFGFDRVIVEGSERLFNSGFVRAE
jgi:hypothetical protein